MLRCLDKVNTFYFVTQDKQPTLEDKVDGKEVRADWQRDHGKGEAHQLPNN
jgi:hypothetical protein